MSRRRGAVVSLAIWLAACSEPVPPPEPVSNPQRELEVRQEVLHQTREVMRYVEEEQVLQQEELRSRDLPAEPSVEPEEP